MAKISHLLQRWSMTSSFTILLLVTLLSTFQVDMIKGFTPPHSLPSSQSLNTFRTNPPNRHTTTKITTSLPSLSPSLINNYVRPKMFSRKKYSIFEQVYLETFSGGQITPKHWNIDPISSSAQSSSSGGGTLLQRLIAPFLTGLDKVIDVIDTRVFPISSAVSSFDPSLVEKRVYAITLIVSVVIMYAAVVRIMDKAVSYNALQERRADLREMEVMGRVFDADATLDDDDDGDDDGDGGGNKKNGKTGNGKSSGIIGTLWSKFALDGKKNGNAKNKDKEVWKKDWRKNGAKGGKRWDPLS